MRAWAAVMWCAACACVAGVQGAPPSLELWYAQPAANWSQALPVGNGRLGGMVFGGVRQERVQLNESSIWEGNPNDREPPKAAEAWRQARDLAMAGRLKEARELVQRAMLLPPETPPRSYQPLGDLFIEIAEDAPPAAASPEPTPPHYRRRLNLEEATAETRFLFDQVLIRRRVFASAPDELLVVHVQAETPPGDTSSSAAPVLPPMRVWLHRDSFEQDIPVRTVVPGKERGRLLLSGRTGQEGVRYAAVAQVHAPGGTLLQDQDGLRVEGAQEFTICLAVRTSFWHEHPEIQVDVDLLAARTPGTMLWGRHAAWFRQRMQRVELHAGGETPPWPTDERLERFRADPSQDPGLPVLLFQYGRYLLLSSSRALPANLQGIWNPYLRAPGNAGFHLNGSLQMNYWPAGVTDLAETELPLLDFLDRLRERGRAAARNLYDCPGWTVHQTTDPWAFTAAEGGTARGVFPMAGPWLVRHAWEHYLFTGNLYLLRTRFFPVMREAAEFVLAYLIVDPGTGQLLSGPSVCPEQALFAPGTAPQVEPGMGAALDQWIALDLLTNLVDAARLLDLTDDPVVIAAQQALPRIARPGVGADGELMAWHRPRPKISPDHWRMNPLFGLHPGAQITPDGTPAEAAAARRTLVSLPARGEELPGGSLAWLINHWARLRDGARAWQALVQLLADRTLPDLLADHPPFQMEGNLGATAGIAEMLLQSHVRYWSNGTLVHRLDLLPALPPAWPEGSVRGLVARGGVRVDMQWREGRLASATLHAPDGGELHVRLPRGTTRVLVRAGNAPVAPATRVEAPQGLVVIPASNGGERTVQLEVD